MNRAVIICAAKIKNYQFLKTLLKNDDYFIFCDGGLNHQKELNVSPDLIIGDFDSYTQPVNSRAETIVLPREKDDTDSIFAAKEAVRRGAKSILLLGVIGGRLDHSIANLSILIKLQKLNIPASIIDNYSQIELVDSNPKFIPDTFPFFSLLNITGECQGVNIQNAKWELTDGKIECNYQYAVSNQVIKGKQAKVWVSKGTALLIKDFEE